MAYAPFFELFPELAAKETRNITVLDSGDLPKGTYAFLESFCNDEDCDCRRVFMNVYAEGRFGFRGQDPLATISFGWEDESFYRKWASYPLSKEDLQELKGPALVRLTHQSEHAPQLLEHFEMLIRDREYVDRIVRHYRMYRESIDERSIQSNVTPIRSQPKPGRNQPCPCGSGKKSKKCCWSRDSNRSGQRPGQSQ
jgi:hypothetical protein